MVPKFLLLENFSWLVQQLSSFDDPTVSYNTRGLPNIRGGARRIYRYGAHYQKYYQSATIQPTPSTVDVTFGTTRINCDQWNVSHPDFEDTNLKEKFPKPSSRLDKYSGNTGNPNHYTVCITSRKSIKDGTATRYYVSCNCPDFETTFKEELIKYGYTNGIVPSGTGVKKLAPAICKHIYAVLLREYKDIIDTESGAQQSAEIEHPAIIPEVEPLLVNIPRGTKPKKTTEEKKAEYAIAIKRSLRFFSNNMRDAIDSYHNTRQTDAAYKKYKFMVKKYFQGYVIVFTNPQLNPMRDKVREKEIVPVLNRTSKGMMPAADSLIVYTKYFTKDELMDMIRSDSRPIQQNQIDRLTKTYKKYTLTESLELLDTISIRTALLEIC